MPPTPPSMPPAAARVPATHVQAALARHASVTQAKPAVPAQRGPAVPRVSPVAPIPPPRAGSPGAPLQQPAHSAQAKPGPQPPQQGSGFRIVTTNAADGPRQIRLAAGGREIGSVEVLDAGRDAVRVVNLKVDPDQRGQGAGAHLMRAAAFEGMRMGKTRVTLESQDNGSGKLTRWYQGMGFTPRGRSDRGMVVLETSAATLQTQLLRQTSSGGR